MRPNAVSKHMLKWLVIQSESKAMCSIFFGRMEARVAMSRRCMGNNYWLEGINRLCNVTKCNSSIKD